MLHSSARSRPNYDEDPEGWHPSFLDATRAIPAEKRVDFTVCECGIFGVSADVIDAIRERADRLAAAEFMELMGPSQLRIMSIRCDERARRRRLLKAIGPAIEAARVLLKHREAHSTGTNNFGRCATRPGRRKTREDFARPLRFRSPRTACVLMQFVGAISSTHSAN
jgi:hypothetical protein